MISQMNTLIKIIPFVVPLCKIPSLIDAIKGYGYKPEELRMLTLGKSLQHNDHVKFLQQEKIREDIYIKWQISNIFTCGVYGSNISTSSPIITISKKFYETFKYAMPAILKHEFAHIKHNDGIKWRCFNIISGLITAIAIRILFNGILINLARALSVTYMTLGITFYTTTLFRRTLEDQADDFAIKHSSFYELEGYKRFFDTFVKKKISFSEMIIPIFVDPHYSNAFRAKKIEEAMKIRKKTLSTIMLSYSPQR